MRDAAGIKTVLLAEYQPPAFLVDKVDLDFTLEPNATRVKARMQMRRNPERTVNPPADCWLDGVNLTLENLSIDGEEQAADRYQQSDKGLTVKAVPDEFVLETTVTNDPANNTALEGLYMSHGMFCTQCEAQGFRRITFYPDRPDVQSKFTVTVRGDKKAYPLLLSNGNPVDKGEDGDTHWVKWEDPFRKPSYLFALVAGDLGCLEDSFTTMSGREVTLRIYAEERDLDKLGHAMTSLKKAMKWDEDTYGREYDLDLFMIVAVSHFNMGAMENKGLNVFNTSCVLANPKTSTDANFQRVESVVAHEYFHNWSGDRVTCRDWFQLSLKEGFTVHREHTFAGEMNSPGVKRVQDVDFLRSQQFPEDKGPMSHPVRPESYQKIDNFYTRTIYDKGSQVVGMQARLLGPTLFRQATDDYFSRFDGTAATVEDFVTCMERASGRDLTQFKRWYSQSGTPQLDVSDDYVDGAYTITFKQHTAPTPGQSEKLPFVIPVSFALLGKDGFLPLNEAGDTAVLLEVDQAEQQFTFQVDEAPVPSILRDFSAPVEVHYDYSAEALKHLLTHDNDGFCRWDAAQRLYISAIERLFDDPDKMDAEADQLADVVSTLLDDTNADPAETALFITLPSETLLGDRQDVWYPATIHGTRDSLKHGIASRLQDKLWQVVEANATPGEYSPDAASIAKRSLRWTALGYLASLTDERINDYLVEVFNNADNMTDEFNALRLLCHYQLAGRIDAVRAFEKRWKHDDLVMDKWFAVQATRPDAGAINNVNRLLKHEQFDMTFPNRVRALLGSFAMGNPVAFHVPSGLGYDIYFSKLTELDKINPQITARMAQAATRLKQLPRIQQDILRGRLERLLDEGCSDNLREVVERILD